MADSFVSKEYLQKQFQNYSTVVKDNFEKKGAVTTETLKYSNVNKPTVDTVKNALDLLFKEGGGGGDSSVTLTQEEYEALTEEEKLNGLYYIYDTKRIYKNGIQYGASEPIPLTMAEYEALKEAGAIDEQQEYLIEADDKGILISAEDIGYNNTKSGIQATTVQGAIDKIAENGGSGEKNVQSDWNETDDTADGFIKNKPTIPSKISQLENDSSYLSSIPEEYVTETELSAKGYLTEHQDISGKVDKVEGKSLISDAEIARLASVDNYDDTDIKAEIAKKADTTTVPSKVSELTNDSNYQTAEQVNSAVTTEIAKIVADAPEDFDTLKEMSDWIAGHEDDASAMNSAISDNKTAITALQTGKADKSEIPTSLPADGGNADTVNNHTVETDVPTDAKFTDTVYDDTEVKESIEELSSNLDTLEFGEVAGGKNLFDGEFINTVITPGINYTQRNLKEEFGSTNNVNNRKYTTFGGYFKKGTYTLSYTNDAWFSFNRTAIAGTNCYTSSGQVRKSHTWTQDVDGFTYFGIEGDDSETGMEDTPFSITPDIMIEKGSTATTPYETYIPSVKMLSDEVSAQKNELDALEYSNVAGGKNLWDEQWTNGVYNELDGIFSSIFDYFCSKNKIKVKPNTIYKFVSPEIRHYIYQYDVNENYIGRISMGVEDIFSTNDNTEYIQFVMEREYGTKYNHDIAIIEGTSGTYKPYIPSVKMLAEEVNQQNESLSVIGKCKNLLNPTLQTTTLNGVTCTNNGDGTYTLNGTAVSTVYFRIQEINALARRTTNKTYKLVGCPAGGINKYDLRYEINGSIANGGGKDFGDGVIIKNDKINSTDITSAEIIIAIVKGITANNLVFKPMLTTNLNATYNDFVPYTGDGATLTEDVAQLKNDLGASNAGAHNSVYRGKYLGNALTTEQKAQISAGTFNDLYIGDYWTIDGVDYRIAAFDYWRISGDTKCTEHHVVIVPDSCLYGINMNVTNVTTGAYINSEMYKTNLEQAKTRINNAFGSANILSHREYLANTTNSTADPSYESAGSWYDSTVELMNEIMVYGANVFHNIEVNGAIPMNYTIDKSQLPLFALAPNRICNRVNWWLRDVVSATSFAHVDRNGNASSNYASKSFGVRPVFGIIG